MSKFRRLLALTVAMLMVFTVILPSSLLALDRYSGDNRYETAVEISNTGWEDGSDVVILARGDNFADALTAVPLAHMHKAPILLTTPDSLPSVTLAEIKRLDASTVYIIGKEAAVSAEIEEQLKNRGITVIRIGGDDRYETAVEIARELAPDGVNTAFIVYSMNFPDALAAASYAAMKGYPILLTDTNTLHPLTEKVIKELGIKHTFVIGGTNVISKRVMNKLPDPERISEDNRYLTSLALAERFNKADFLYFATGTDKSGGADAIAGGALAAKQGTGILLVGNSLHKLVAEYLGQGIESAFILGGRSAVSTRVANAIEKALYVPEEPEEPEEPSTPSRIPVSAITVSPKTMTLTVGATGTITAKVSPDNATNKKVNWTSSDTSVVTVDANGNVSAVDAGTALITATSAADSTKKATCTIKVISDAANVEAQDFGVIENYSGVTGYSVGFGLVDATVADVEQVVITLYNDTMELASVTSDKALRNYPDATGLSAPFDVLGAFDYAKDEGGNWKYSGWKGYTTDIPTKAQITVTFKNGEVQTALNTNLTGDTSIFNAGSIDKTVFWGTLEDIFYYSEFTLGYGWKIGDLSSLTVTAKSGDEILSTITLLDESFTEFSNKTKLGGSFRNNPGETTEWWNVPEFDGTMPTEIVVEYTEDGKTYRFGSRDVTWIDEGYEVNVKAQDFGVMKSSGVIGYTTGLKLIGATASDVREVVVELFDDNNDLLASNSSAGVLEKYKEHTILSAPFDVLGTFDYAKDEGGNWIYSGWTGNFTDIPTKAVITVTFNNGVVRTATNETLTGDSDFFTKKVINITKFAGFDQIQAAIKDAKEADTIIVSAGTYEENISIDKAITLLSYGGREKTSIEPEDNQKNTIELSGSTDGVRIGAVGQGFTIKGSDHSSPGIETASIYIKGSHENVVIEDNEVIANGDSALLAEYASSIQSAKIIGNTFSGKTFVGETPAGQGTSQQFVLSNVPRTLVYISNASLKIDVVFTDNTVTGITGGLNSDGQPQGNTIVTIDAHGAQITNNTFCGNTAWTAASLRARGTNTTVDKNEFKGSELLTTHIILGEETVYGGVGAVLQGNTFEGAVVIEGKPVIYSKIQAAIDTVRNLATPSPTIYAISVLEGTYDEEIEILQQENKSIELQADMIDGDYVNVTLKGAIKIDGDGRSSGEESLAIRGFTFDFSNSEDVNIISATKGELGSVKHNYAHNIWIEDNLFIGNKSHEVVAIRTATGSTFGLTIMNCEGIDLHSLGQLSIAEGMTIADCTVTGGESGINYYGDGHVAISNLTVEGTNYGVRAGQGSGTLNASATLTITSSNLRALYPIWLRGDAPMNVTVNDTTLSALSGGEDVHNQAESTVTIN